MHWLPTIGISMPSAKLGILLDPSGHSSVRGLWRGAFPLRLVMINKTEQKVFCRARGRGCPPVLSQPCGKPHIYILSFEFLPYKNCSERKRNDKYGEDRSRDGQVAPKAINVNFINKVLATENGA